MPVRAASSTTLPPQLARLIKQCSVQRKDLPAQGTTFYRAVHTTETGGLFALERAGSVGVLSLYADFSAEQEVELAAACAETGLSSLYLKRRPREASHAANVEREWLSPPQPIWGQDLPELTALENGVPYLIRPGHDLSIGLFSDARPARAWVRQRAQGSRVLNTFAYTCGFGVSAALAGAERVKNLDLSRKVLSWGQENYALSGLAAPDTDFVYGDVFDWLGRLGKRGEQFDLVILDPPSFARSKAGVWRSERDYARLLTLAASVTAPGGQVLALCNHAGLAPATFDKMLSAGAALASRRLSVTARFGAGQDYPGAEHLKVRALKLA
ncbi:class I SAM-dependent rRNA methyltransferase [Deinococcus psychrotolerans]|uniref:Class I SAM-dependent rRNA methyltransferase n=1 Tax=Deinococcus psychrotolerans TaxID=2489213 RepID=A0A3G8YB43_9DEIO|nr:class I SAM-dependent rRNA methyltransferase [Deinococcus psychrotolerans]AZI42609.1 class I SAM-dependent rRNA methyltransferase [Deinococcus psychrotolerans]